jgi:riboflavin synthase
MFTGIIEEIGTIKAIRQGMKSSQITIGAKSVTCDMKIGDSINTDGVCLTVTGFTKDEFTVDVMPETMERTVIGKLKRGGGVNLERALRLSDRLGGHLVSGHIDGTGKISRSWNDENAIWFSIDASIAILKYIVEKGSVAVDGISLTVVRVDEESFDVSIIPHTQANTTLPSKRLGDTVNIECDLIAKYLEKLQQHHPGESIINPEFLSEHGFL